MEQIIRKILKEEVTANKDSYQRNMIDILKREGFDRTPYQKILNYLNDIMGIVGMEARVATNIHK